MYLRCPFSAVMQLSAGVLRQGALICTQNNFIAPALFSGRDLGVSFNSRHIICVRIYIYNTAQHVIHLSTKSCVAIEQHLILLKTFPCGLS